MGRGIVIWMRIGSSASSGMDSASPRGQKEFAPTSLLAQDLDGRGPSVRRLGDADPQRDERLQPPRAFDPADVDGRLPTELAKEGGRLSLRAGVVPRDDHGR